MKKAIILVLALAMLLTLAACGEKKADEAAEPVAAADAAPAAESAEAPAVEAAPEAPAGDASGEPGGDASGEPAGDASGEPSGDPPADAELFEPNGNYSKDWAGYQQYVIDAFSSDPNAPDDLKETAIPEIQAVADDSAEVFTKFLDAGLILSFDEFMAS